MKPPFRYEKLGYAALDVTDLDKSVHFYKELMDCIGTSIRDGSLAGMRRRLEEAYQESGLV
mgnify:CR=1 FL=1